MEGNPKVQLRTIALQQKALAHQLKQLVGQPGVPKACSRWAGDCEALARDMEVEEKGMQFVSQPVATGTATLIGGVIVGDE